jgi:colicin import membrane protein
VNAAVMAPLPDPARLPSAVLAVSVHVVLFMFLFFGVRWSTNTPEAVVVELWTTPPSVEPVQERVEPPPATQPPKPLPKVEPRPEPKVEAKPPPATKKPDIVVEKDKKVVKPELPKPPPVMKKPEPPKPDNLKFDLTARMREELAKELSKSAPRTEPAKPAASSPPSAPVVDAGYAARIRAAIRNRIVVPPDIQGNPEAIFDVIQLPTREVLSVTLRKSSGNRAYDEAVERAIRGASPLPAPDAPNQVQRQLELKFRPKDPL